ncbi:MAG: hypothetical protein Kow0047_06630 [Anaerolineae bacterium]
MRCSKAPVVTVRAWVSLAVSQSLETVTVWVPATAQEQVTAQGLRRHELSDGHLTVWSTMM